MIKITNAYFEQMAGSEFEAIMNKPWDITTSYRIAVLVGELRDKAKPYFQAKDSLMRKYGEKDEKGKIVIGEGGNVRIKDVKAYTEEMKILQEMPIKLDRKKFDLVISEVKKYLPAGIPPKELLLLIPLFNIVEDSDGVH